MFNFFNYVQILLIIIILALVPRIADSAVLEVVDQQGSSQPQRPPVAKGNFDLAFDIYDGKNPEQAGLIATDSKYAIPLRNGRFAVTIPFPKELQTTPELWLQIQAAEGGTGQFMPLNEDSLPVKSNIQTRVSSQLQISGKILQKSGQFVLGPYETRWLTDKSITQPSVNLAQNKKSNKKPDLEKPTPELVIKRKKFTSVLARIQQDLQLNVGEFSGFMKYPVNWGLEPVPVFASYQILDLMDPDNTFARSELPASIVFMTSMDEEMAARFMASKFFKNPISLSFEYQKNTDSLPFLTLDLEQSQIVNVAYVDHAHLAVVKVKPSQVNIRYVPASTEAIELSMQFSPSGFVIE